MGVSERGKRKGGRRRVTFLLVSPGYSCTQEGCGETNGAELLDKKTYRLRIVPNSKCRKFPGGFSGGLWRKDWLLTLEGIKI